MKLLYAVIVLLGLIQWSTPQGHTKIPKELLEFHKQELNNINKEFAAETKILFEKCLKDEYIRKASTPGVKKFKEAIIDFLNKYPTYTRERRYTELMATFNTNLIKLLGNKLSGIVKELERHFEINQIVEDLNLEF